jgi:hypothetical protein
MKKQFRSFEDARKFARGLGLKRQDEWFEYCKSGNRPKDIPRNPSDIYKNKGWKGNGDWLGTGRTRNYRSFEDARKFVQSLGLKNWDEWYDYCNSGNKPNDIPSSPQSVYKEWKKGK